MRRTLLQTQSEVTRLLRRYLAERGDEPEDVARKLTEANLHPHLELLEGAVAAGENRLATELARSIAGHVIVMGQSGAPDPTP